MSQETQQGNKTFQITKALIEGYHEQGYTVKEMADNITTLSGIKCSVGTINRAAKIYKIDMRTKPRKNGFVFEEVAPSTIGIQTTEGTIVEAELVEDNPESSRAYSF